ncbi:MAG TPA: Flp pilus assembly protein CpaB [Gemmataceae bacterium]|jgi:pilus assembly protein CpaB|nr:Flp pilus assembly protein CpaB [Gemmataceae bacterium]
MKSKTMILVAVALVCGVGAAYMTSRLIADRSETVTVLMPKQKYGQWMLIKDPDAMFEQKEILKSDAPKTAVLRIEDLKDRILLRALPAGQPVVYEDLQDKNKGSLESQLTPGMLAVAIKTDAASAVGGFVLPGSHVDIFHVGRNGDRMESKVILQNVLVRAIDLQPVRPDDRPGVVPATVTVEVTREQSLTLIGVKDTGTITLALRSVGDTTEVADPTPKRPVVPPVPPPPPTPPTRTEVVKKSDIDRKSLTIWNGPRWSRATFVTQGGTVTTEIVNSSADEAPPPLPPAPKKVDAPPKKVQFMNVPASPAGGGK